MRRSALVTVAILLSASAPLSAREEIVEGIAAQVGGEIVLISEVLQMVEPVEKKMREAGMPQNEIAKLRAEGLERMIEWRLIEEVVREAELYASDAEIDQTIEQIARENGISVEQLRESVESQGMSYVDYRAQIKRELERHNVVQAMIGSQIQVQEEEVRALYEQRYASQPREGEQFHLRQLLVRFGEETGRDREQACEIVREARERILEGQSFAVEASRHSEVAAARGGDIGWVHEDAMTGWMKVMVLQLQPGETSAVGQLHFGCMILHLVERQKFENITYEVARPVLENEARENLLAEKYREWIEKLRERTYIERRGYFAEATGQFQGPTPGGLEESQLP